MKSSARRRLTFRTRQLPYLAAAGALLIGLVVAGVRHLDQVESEPAASASADLATFVLPPPTVSARQVANEAPGGSVGPLSLSAEIDKVRPMISETSGALDRGTASLALWASTQLTWADLKSLKTTSAALFRKDPDQERGRVICIDGTIQEIRAEKNLSHRLVADRPAPLVGQSQRNATAALGLPGTDQLDSGLGAPRALYLGANDADWAVPGGKVFIATIVDTDRGDRSKSDDAQRAKAFAVEAIAVKSSGTLVDGDHARFCGILTGVVQVANDTALLHRAVGLFDLPENTGAPAHAGAKAP